MLSERCVPTTTVGWPTHVLLGGFSIPALDPVALLPGSHRYAMSFDVTDAVDVCDGDWTCGITPGPYEARIRW